VRRFLVAVSIAATASAGWRLHAQGPAQGRGQGPAAPPVTARAAAPFDITGYWVSLVTDDWRYRMLTPPKGNVDYLPVTAEARRVTNEWDPAKDAAAGEQCKAYGAGGIMRLPARLHITWDDDHSLKMDVDAGTQTRRFFFESTPQLAAVHPPTEPSWQGYSIARWDFPPAGRGAVAPGRGGAGRIGQLRVVTNRLRPGYVRRNGVPYGANATVTEYYVHLVDQGQEYLVVTTIVDDPMYFQPAYIKTYEFKKQRDATGWNPRPCGGK
jgi:hypothetical protein